MKRRHVKSEADAMLVELVVSLWQLPHQHVGLANSDAIITEAASRGYNDRQIGQLMGRPWKSIGERRRNLGVRAGHEVRKDRDMVAAAARFGAAHGLPKGSFLGRLR